MYSKGKLNANLSFYKIQSKITNRDYIECNYSVYHHPVLNEFIISIVLRSTPEAKLEWMKATF